MKQKVAINSVTSGWAWVTSVAPQMSILGPLVFTLYVNDMVERIVPIIFSTSATLDAVCKSNKKTFLGLVIVLIIGKCHLMWETVMLCLLVTEISELSTFCKAIFSKGLVRSWAWEKNKQNNVRYIKRQFSYMNEKPVPNLNNAIARLHLDYAVQFSYII